MKKSFLYPVLTGLLIGTSYIPFPPWAMLFGIVPLWFFWLEESNPWRAFAAGWLAQFIFNVIGFHWIGRTPIEFANFPVWAGVLTLIGFASIAHLYYPLTGFLFVWLQNRLKLGVFSSVGLILALFGVTEFFWPSIFPWHLGYPWLWADLPGVQVSDVIGFEGLNIIAQLCNALFLIGWLRFSTGVASDARGSRWRRAWPWAAAALGLFLATNLLGLGRDREWKATADDPRMKLLVVQGNIGNFDKLMQERRHEFGNPVTDKYLDLSRQGLLAHPETEFILWPETAFPASLQERFWGNRNQNLVVQFLRETKRNLVTGAYSYNERDGQPYNSLYFVDPLRGLVGRPYRKSILIPFGERFPLSDIIPYMPLLFPNYRAFEAGPGPSVYSLGGVKFGAQICLESLYPWFSAALARDGAEVIANVTNDSWFGKNFEPYQHMIMTLARGVENRRPLLRSTNTGFTTVILADGTVLPLSPQMTEWAGFYEVPIRKNPRVVFYSRIAGYPALLWGLILAMILGWGWRRRSLK